MFNVPSFDCICMAWKLWVNRLVPDSSQHSDERTKRGKMRKHNGHPSSLRHPAEDDTDKTESSTRNRHSWHVGSTSVTCKTALSFDQTSLEGFPGDPHSGSNGVPHGDYRKSWHVTSPTRATSVTNGPVIHQSSCPSSFYRPDKPKRNLKLPLRTESCPNPSHNHPVVLESQQPKRRTRPQNLNFEQSSSLEFGATGSDNSKDISLERTNHTMQCRQNRRLDFWSRSGKQEAFDEDDATLDSSIFSAATHGNNTNNTDDKLEDTDSPSSYANVSNNNGSAEPVSKGGRTMRCKDCGGRIVVSITTPTPTSSAPRIYRLKR